MLENHVKSRRWQAGTSVEMLTGLAQVSSAGVQSRPYTLKEKFLEAFEDIAFFYVSDAVQDISGTIHFTWKKTLMS